jgi:glycosyltransferase involved in cell wall biosynthesis
LSVAIVTVVKDHAPGLLKTHKSLVEQTFENWKMIIVVGVSTDETLSVARALESEDSRICVIEQKGTGIYGAMNEGLDSDKADFTWFMNAGDQFANAFCLANGVHEILQNDVGLVIGGYQIDDSDARHVYSYPGRSISLLAFAFNRRSGCHQSMIFRTDVLGKIGGFSNSYLLAADFELVLKVIRDSKAVRVTDVYASIEPGGRATQGIFRVHKEKHHIRRNLLGGPFIFVASLVWTLLARAKIVIRRFG